MVFSGCLWWFFVGPACTRWIGFGIVSLSVDFGIPCGWRFEVVVQVCLLFL